MPKADAVRRVAIVGAESSGKSTLAAALAAHYGTIWVPEYAREYLAATQGAYTEADIPRIAQGQLHAENHAAQHAQQWLFCDTEALVCKIWMEYKYGYCDAAVEAQFQQQSYAIFLLCAPDVAWEPDPLRELPDQAARLAIFDRYQTVLAQYHKPFVVISGDLPARMRQCLAALSRFSA